jgi:hypothetical protein
VLRKERVHIGVGDLDLGADLAIHQPLRQDLLADLLGVARLQLRQAGALLLQLLQEDLLVGEAALRAVDRLVHLGLHLLLGRRHVLLLRLVQDDLLVDELLQDLVPQLLDLRRVGDRLPLAGLVGHETLLDLGGEDRVVVDDGHDAIDGLAAGGIRGGFGRRLRGLAGRSRRVGRRGRQKPLKQSPDDQGGREDAEDTPGHRDPRLWRTNSQSDLLVDDARPGKALAK